MYARNFRRVAQPVFVKNSELLLDLPKVHDYRAIGIELDGTLQVATNAATSVPADSPCDLIDRLDLIANGKDVLSQMPFVFAVMGNYGRAHSQEMTAPGTTIATHPFRAVGWIDLFNSWGMRPKDSAFQAYLSQLFQLRLVTRDETAIIVKGTAVLTLTVTNLSIWVDSQLEAADAGEPRAFKKRTYNSIEFSGAQSALRMDLPVGNFIKEIAIRVTDGGAPADTLVNSIELAINDTDVRAKTAWKALRSLNTWDRMGRAPAAGFAYLDSVTDDGKLSNAYDTRAASDVKLVFDVAAPTGTGKIEIVTTEYILP